jgi:hypothetical protein
MGKTRLGVVLWGGLVLMGIHCKSSEEENATSTSTTTTTSGGSTGSGMTECTDADFKACGTDTTCKKFGCNGGKCVFTPAVKGTACTEEGGKVCDDAGKCVGMNCTDMLQDADETDVDCGGACSPCAAGQKCAKAADCATAYCLKVDEKLSLCKACAADMDCEAGKFCDLTKGTCTPRGANGAACAADNECTSTHCADKVCCDTACAGTPMTGDGGCDVCAKALGASADGTCTVLKAGDPGKCGQFLCEGTKPDCPTKCTNDTACAATAFCDTITGTCQPEPVNGCKKANAIDVSAEASPFNIAYASSANPPAFNATIKGMATQLTFPICLKVKQNQVVNICVNPPTCNTTPPQGAPIFVGGTIDSMGLASYDAKSPIQPKCYNGTFDPNSMACRVGGSWPCGKAGLAACASAQQTNWTSLVAYPFYNNSKKDTQQGVLYIVP